MTNVTPPGSEAQVEDDAERPRLAEECGDMPVVAGGLPFSGFDA